MGTCRCDVLNVLSGELARDYLDVHLQHVRTDGMGRTVHRCEASEVEWVEEHRPSGYDDDVMMLRRVQR